MGPFIDYVATNLRSMALIVVVLPLSFVLRNVLAFRYETNSLTTNINITCFDLKYIAEILCIEVCF